MSPPSSPSSLTSTTFLQNVLGEDLIEGDVEERRLVHSREALFRDRRQENQTGMHPLACVQRAEIHHVVRDYNEASTKCVMRNSLVARRAKIRVVHMARNKPPAACEFHQVGREIFIDQQLELMRLNAGTTRRAWPFLPCHALPPSWAWIAPPGGAAPSEDLPRRTAPQVRSSVE